jgi:hypothetical protein
VSNRLAAASSPYLREHADNPVDWYPWGDEALGRARELDRPILLSIGYSACHWCHVMAAESFADPDVAQLMNERFVCVKVDREEMPDLDAIYQQALALMGQSGGWPLTMLLTPDLKPFFGGTYFPPREGYGRPSFRRVVVALGQAWRQERGAVTRDADAVQRALADLGRRTGGDAAPGGTFPADGIERAARALAADLDPRHGGFGAAPKFPHAAALELVLRGARRLRAGGDAAAGPLAAGVRTTLERMAAGGIHDQLGGGFARYSTDAEWLVPHFEKMAYDNAQALRLYVDAALVFDEPGFAQVARQTAAWLLRDLQAAAGGFYTALDADSEGVEGKYYVWTPDAIAAVVGPAAAAVVARCYDVRPDGNWRDPHGHAPAGTSILHRVAEPAGDTERALLGQARRELLRARQERVPPRRDTKILCGVNGLVIGALAEAGRVLCEPGYVDAARRAAAFILEHLRGPDGRLLRTWHDGVARLPGTLEDHAFVADGLIALYEATGEARWLEEALRLATLCLDRFYEPTSRTFYLTAPDDPHLIVRPTATTDGPMPSGMAACLRCLVRLADTAGGERCAAVARDVAAAHARAALQSPFAYASFLGAVDLLDGGVTQVVLAGEDVAALERALAGVYLPSRLIVHAAGAPAALAPLCAGKGPVGGQGAAWVCRDGACQAPVTEPERLRDLLRDAPDAGPAAVGRAATPPATPAARRAP